MKLADKRTIQTVMAGQRKSQIDEGVAIAKKIDVLRQTLSSLQQQHQDFVSGMSEELRNKTEALQIEIDGKQMMLLDLEEKRQQLLEPLTEAWNEVREREKKIYTEEQDYAQKRLSLTILNQNLEERAKIVVEEEKSLSETKKQVQEQIDVALKTSLEAQNALIVAREEESRIFSNLDKKDKEITKRETELVVKERDIKIQINFIEKEKLDITKIKQQLADQRQTLERAMKRINI